MSMDQERKFLTNIQWKAIQEYCKKLNVPYGLGNFLEYSTTNKDLYFSLTNRISIVFLEKYNQYFYVIDHKYVFLIDLVNLYDKKDIYDVFVLRKCNWERK